MNQTRYIGTDVSSEEFVSAYPQIPEDRFEEQRFGNDVPGINSFIDTLDREKDHVIVEATGVYSMRLVWMLCEAKVKVSVISPQQSQGYISQILGDNIKNDSRDARNLSKYGKTFSPPVYVPKSEQVQKASQLQKLYSQLVIEKGAIENRLHALSYQPFPEETVVKINQEMLAFYDQKIKQVKDEMIDIDQDEFNKLIKLLSSIPGIGQVTATALVIITNGLATFSSAKQLTKFIGVNPTQKESGKSVRGKSTIPKRGNRRLRALLYNCAKSAKRWNPKCKELYDRLRVNGKCHKVAMIAVVRQLVRYVFAVAKTEIKYDKNYKPVLIVQ